MVIAALTLATVAHAQTNSDSTWRTATLEGWQYDTRRYILDRKHSYGGLFYDRGLFRRLTPQMDHEYELDVFSYDFTLQEDAQWYDEDHGFRSALGSIDVSHFAVFSHVRSRVALESHQFYLTAFQQEDLRAQRLFVQLGYSYGLGAGHRIGARQTLARYKPDLDFTAFYAYKHPAWGSLQFDVTILDVFNDFIFEGLGVDPVHEDTTRSYGRRPFPPGVRIQTATWRGLRGEVYAGRQTESRALVSSQAHHDRHFYWTNRAAYTGILLEYIHSLFTAGITYRSTSGASGRRAPPASAFTSDYKSAQSTGSLTTYLLGGWRQLRAEAWLTWARYHDIQEGDDFDQALLPQAFNYSEDRLLARLRVRYIPAHAGPLATLAYIGHFRSFPTGKPLDPYLRFLQNETNHRLSLQLGYQFRPGIYGVVGANYDIDGDPFYSDRPLTRYDGGVARFVIMW